MGYNTTFIGSLTISPALTAAEQAAFHAYRHRTGAPYWHDTNPRTEVDNPGPTPRPEGDHGYGYCGWEIVHGNELRWDESEKFYYAEQWLAIVVEHFVPEHCTLKGEIVAQGEEPGDLWKIKAKGRKVTRHGATFARTGTPVTG